MPTTYCLLSDMLLAVNLPLLTTIFDVLCFFLALLLSSSVSSAFLGCESTMAKWLSNCFYSSSMSRKFSAAKGPERALADSLRFLKFSMAE